MRKLKWNGEIIQLSDWSHWVNQRNDYFNSVWRLERIDIGYDNRTFIQLYCTYANPSAGQLELWSPGFADNGVLNQHKKIYGIELKLPLDQAKAHIDKFLDRLNSLGSFI